MRIEPGTAISLDTNILLDATDVGRELHTMALRTLSLRPPAGWKLFIGTQVLREYLVVATRSKKSNGLGLTVRDAITNVRTFCDHVEIIPESIESSNLLLKWIAAYKTTGAGIHDLQILATSHAAGIPAFLTSNVDDFPKTAGPRILALRDVDFE